MATGTIHRSAPDDADTLIKTVYYTSAWPDTLEDGKSLSLPANGFKNGSLVLGNAISGYRMIGVGRFTSGTQACYITTLSINATGTSAAMTVRNNSGATQKNKTAGIEILYIRDSFCG